jgi:hypothetical protein
MQTGTDSLSAGTNGGRSKAYKCSVCKSVISYSNRLVAVLGKKWHRMKYSAGDAFCELFTFSSCPGALNIGDPNEGYSWFPGYVWSLALCRRCGNHLGWHYKAGPGLPMAVESIGIEELPEFWGITVQQVFVDESEFKEPVRMRDESPKK